jgi:hypothetical protein
VLANEWACVRACMWIAVSSIPPFYLGVESAARQHVLGLCVVDVCVKACTISTTMQSNKKRQKGRYEYKTRGKGLVVAHRAGRKSTRRHTAPHREFMDYQIETCDSAQTQGDHLLDCSCRSEAHCSSSASSSLSLIYHTDNHWRSRHQRRRS